MSLAGKTLFITGATRGIGLAIGLRAARDGANVVIAATTAKAHQRLPGTIYTAASAIEAAGGRALPIVADVRDELSVQRAVYAASDLFGGIDICVNNASVAMLRSTADTQLSHFDLMHQVNVRGTFVVTKACLPHLRRSANPHVLMIAPPLDLSLRWFRSHLAYSVSKFGMSLCVLGMAHEFEPYGIAVNALWPRTAIATAATRRALGGGDEGVALTRTLDIMADAAHLIFTKTASSFSGRFLIDDTVLYDGGEREFDRYRVDPTKSLLPAMFLSEGMSAPPGVTLAPVSQQTQAPKTTRRV